MRTDERALALEVAVEGLEVEDGAGQARVGERGDEASGHAIRLTRNGPGSSGATRCATGSVDVVTTVERVAVVRVASSDDVLVFEERLTEPGYRALVGVDRAPVVASEVLGLRVAQLGERPGIPALLPYLGLAELAGLLLVSWMARAQAKRTGSQVRGLTDWPEGRRACSPLSMDRDFWLARWREGRIGFHEGRPNAHLVAHGESLGLAGARVFVPLCGKAVDLAWLAARAEEVVGVELATAAVEAFFEEHGLVPQRTQAGRMTLYEAENITIWAGDLFELDSSMVGALDVCFDRAALVAVRPTDRARYVAHVRSLLAPAARALLVTFEHDGPPREPPFSVPEAEVRTLWDGAHVELVGEVDALAPGAALASRGATFAREKVYRIG
ncbi:MAG: hypothetical protein OHK0013_43090 [Sandaracinaceae bacterium]